MLKSPQAIFECGVAMRLSSLLLSTIAFVPSLVLAHQHLVAPQPVAGNWFNPSEDGRGWVIENQNDVISVTHFVYDEAGNSTFYLNSGAWDPETQSIESDLYSFRDGQCLGCTYKAPESEVIGTAKLEFSSSTKGTVTYSNGVVIAIEKMAFGAQVTPLHVLQGVWSLFWYEPEQLPDGVSLSSVFFDEIEEDVYIGPPGAGDDHDGSGYVFEDGTTYTGPVIYGTSVFTDLPEESRRIAAIYVDDEYRIFMPSSHNVELLDSYYAMIEGEAVLGRACSGPIEPAGAHIPAKESCAGVLSGVRAYTYSEARKLFGSKTGAE